MGFSFDTFYYAKRRQEHNRVHDRPCHTEWNMTEHVFTKVHSSLDHTVAFHLEMSHLLIICIPGEFTSPRL